MMPCVYLIAVVDGQRIRYLHSSPDTQSAAEALAHDLNAGFTQAFYCVKGDDD